MHLKKQFVHKEILKIFPWIKPRTLISWSERGLITPEFEDASGRGTRRKYSYRNLIKIGFVDELLKYGIPFSTIRGFLEEGGSRAKDKLFEKGFDVVVCISRYSVFHETKTMLITRLQVESEQDFLSEGGEIALGKGRYDAELSAHEDREGGSTVTSGIYINLKGISEFIDHQISKL
jgi:DNA-binding transcriptional MerR regulator